MATDPLSPCVGLFRALRCLYLQVTCEDRNGKLGLGGRVREQDGSGQGQVDRVQAQSQRQPRMLPAGGAAAPQRLFPGLPTARRGAPSPGKGWAPRLPRVVGEWLGPHRPGQLGKILPRKLDHIPHPQDGAERGLVGVEATGLHVGSSQIGKEVSPGREERREARPSVNTKTVAHEFFSSLQEPQGPSSPRQGIPRLTFWTPAISLTSVLASFW